MTVGSLPRLMLVTDRKRVKGRDLVRCVSRAAAAGLELVQIREKDLTAEALTSLVRRIQAAVPPSTRILVNGNAAVAHETGSGLHLPGGAPWDNAVHTELVGRSLHSREEGWVAAGEGLAYVIAGTIFATASKPGRMPAGVGLIEALVPRLGPIPLYAIGGITIPRVPEVMRAGSYGVAVSGAILEAADPARVVQGFNLALQVAGR